MTTLKEAIPKEIKVKCAGENFVVRSFGFVKYIKHKDALAKVIGTILSGYLQAGDDGKEEYVKEIMYDVVPSCVDEVEELFQAVTGKDREWMEKLDPEEGAELFYALINVNIDFFRQRLARKALHQARENEKRKSENKSKKKKEKGKVLNGEK